MEKILSLTNEKIKRLVRLFDKEKERKSENCFLAEGLRLVSEMPEDKLKELYVTEEFLEKIENEEDTGNIKVIKNIIKKADSEKKCYILTHDAMKKAASTDSPQGIIAIVQRYSWELKDLSGMEDKALIVILDHLQDPGNVGTIFRTAEAAGATGILVSNDTAGIYTPKVVRSTMGAIFRVPFIISETREDFISYIEKIHKNGIVIYGMHLDGNEFFSRNYKKSAAFLIGNEGNGLGEDTAKEADELIRIPMKGKVESLNAAMSTTIVLYEALRQRTM